MNKILIYMILLIDLCFFYLIPRPGIIGSLVNNYQKIGLTLFIVISISLVSKKIFKNNKYLFMVNIFNLLLLITGEIVISYIRFGQSPKSLLATSNHYIIIIAYFLIYYYLNENNNRLEALEIILIKFISTISIILLIQYIVYNFTGILFLNIDKQRTISSIRFGSIRIYEGGYLPIFGIVLSFGILLKRHKSLKIQKMSMVCLIASLMHLIFVSKSRMGLVMAGLSCGFMILRLYSKNRVKKYTFMMLFVVILFIMVRLSFINQFITSINMKDYSLLTRIDAIEYYSEQLKENIFLGLGFIEPIEGDSSYYFVKGPSGMYYKDDMGLLGLVHTFGIVGLCWYTFMIIKVCKVLILLRRQNMQQNYIELYGMTFLVFAGSIVMNPFDPQRIVVFPFLLALIDAAYRNVKLKKFTKNIDRVGSKYEVYN